MYTGWHREKYYLVDENNNRTALQTSELVHRQGSFYINRGSLSAGTSCKVSGAEFFYGPKEKLIADNPIKQDEDFLKLHPGCGQQDEKGSP